MIMTEIECAEYVEKEVRAICIDGQIIEGYLSNTVSKLDSVSGKPEIDIVIEDYCISIPCFEIKCIQVIE